MLMRMHSSGACFLSPVKNRRGNDAANRVSEKVSGVFFFFYFNILQLTFQTNKKTKNFMFNVSDCLNEGLG